MGDAIGEVMNWILYFLVWCLSKAASLISTVLFWAAEWSDFTKMTQIVRAWIVVRDFSNMIFIIILLVIAFGTILKLESYSYKKLLGRMVLMAVLVNFSKSICGIMIDAAQVFMFTFLKALEDVKAAGLMQAFGLDALMQAPSDKTAEYNKLNIFFALFLAGAMLAIFCVVSLTYTVMLVLRVAMLWLLIVLSPLAYALNVLPATQSYAKEWWKKFTNYLILGPMIAFFLWIVMFIATYKEEGQTVAGSIGGLAIPPGPSAGTLTEAAAPETFASFIIATLLLFGGLQMTTSLATEFSKVTGKVTALGFAGLAMAGRRLDDVQNFARAGAGWGLKKVGAGFKLGANKVGLESGKGWSALARTSNFVGEAFNKTGSVVGSQLTLRPAEIMKTGKEILAGWEQQRMVGSRSNLNKVMQATLAPTRWGGNLGQKLTAKKVSQENANAYTVDEAMDAVTNGSWKKVQKAQETFEKSGKTPADRAAFNKVLTDSLVHLSNPADKQRVLDALQEKVDTLGERSRDLNYSAGQRGRMDEASKVLRNLMGAINTGAGVGQAGRGTVEGIVLGRGIGANVGKDAREKLSSFERSSEATKKWTKPLSRGGETIASIYAGSSTADNRFMQQEIAEAAKRLELEIGDNTELNIARLGDAIRRGDGATMIAAFKNTVATNDPNELHRSSEVMDFFREAVRKHFVDQGVKGEALDQTMEHFEGNYTEDGYLAVFKKALLLKAFNGDNNAAGREDQNLSNSALKNSAGWGYGSSLPDADTGYTTWNLPRAVQRDVPNADGTVTRKWVGEANPSQIAAITGKRRNINDSTIASSVHPQTLVARGTDGSAGGLTANGAAFAKAFSQDMANKIASMRPDTKESIVTSPQAMLDLVQLMRRSIGQEKKNVATMLAAMVGMGKGKFIDKQAGRFSQNFSDNFGGTGSKAVSEEQLEAVIRQLVAGNENALNDMVERVGVSEKKDPAPTP